MINFDDIKVPEGMEFSDISTEDFRKYHYPEGDSQIIDHPVALHVQLSGNHRVIDNMGMSHIIAGGWRRISFRANPHFVI